MEDFRVLQTCQSRPEFDAMSEKFLDEWMLISDEMDTFLAYFDKTWLKSKESNWFAGAGPLNHNNGLEGRNRDIKNNKVLRPRQPMGDFIKNAFDIVKIMSIDDHRK